MKVEKKVQLLTVKLRELKPDPRVMNIKFISKDTSGSILVDYRNGQKAFDNELPVEELLEAILDGSKVKKEVKEEKKPAKKVAKKKK